MKFIHLSDIHLHADRRLHRGIDPRKNITLAVNSIRTNFSDVALCMVTGDLADKGETDAYGDVVDILNQLPCPWYPLMGNHDDRANAQTVLGNAGWHKDGFLQYELQTEVGCFLALDSVLGRGGGFLCEQRLSWLKNALDAAQSTGTDVFLFMHHVPFDIGIDWLDAIKMENGDELGRLLANYTNIRHLFMGHVHRPCYGSWNGIPFSTVRTTAHQVALQLGDAAPSFIEENPSYAVVLIDKSKVVIHNHSFLEENKLRHR